MKKSRYVAIKNSSDSSTLELYFLDIIQDEYDWFTGMQISKVQEIIDKVNYYKPSKILCIIDSVGGDAQTGMSIYNFLKRCDAKIEVEVIGLAGSIASVIAMAANKGKLRIARNAFMMIHKAEGMCWGTSDEIRQMAEVIDKYTNEIVDIYSQRTGKPIEEVNALIADGDYWMSGQEAVEQGFADETFNDVAPNLQIAARLDLDVYKNMPAQIRAQLKPSEKEDSTTHKILDEMKKLGERIMNALGLHKPTHPEDSAILNQVGSVMQPVLDEFSGEVETTITNRVNEAIGSPAVNGAIATQVSNAIAGIDFTAEGPARTALQAAVTNMIQNAFKPDGNTEARTAIQAMIDAATADLRTKSLELENDILRIKGKPVNTGGTENNGGYVARGKVVK